MNKEFENIIAGQLQEITEKGLFKEERVITSKQGREISVGKKKYLNFCSNNYLGLSGRKELISAGKKALDKWGFGLSSVRFICGTQQIHKDLEKQLAKFLGYEDALLYTSAFDANTGLFQTLLGPEDAIISDQLNHASMIDGTRLCKAERHIYRHSDMGDLEAKLKLAKDKRIKLIATDGVFSMEGDIANMPEICALAKKYGALVMMDDSHATGFMGKTGKGTHELFGLGSGDIDFITSTLGKALGGASGGFVVSSKQNISFLRQRSRNYIFSNSLAPVIAGTTVFAIDYLKKNSAIRKQLWQNVEMFRRQMQQAGFEISKDVHPIVPIMVGDAKVAKAMAAELFKEGIYVIGFSYPVVPEGKARVRVQISAAHTKQDIDRAVKAFTKTGKKLGYLK